MTTVIFNARIVAEIDEAFEHQYTAHLMADMIGLDTRGCPGFNVAGILVDRRALVEDNNVADICPMCFGNLSLPYMFADDHGNCHGLTREERPVGQYAN